jgi:hypothetical protein
MQDDRARTSPGQPPSYSAEKARGGEIILRRPWQRAVFIAGLAIPLILLLILLIYR